MPLSEGSNRAVTVWMLWIQLLAGPILWSIHFVLGYLLVEASCRAGWGFTILGINGLSFLVIVFTLLASVGTGLFGLKSFRGWRNINSQASLRDQFRETAQWSEGAVEFVYFSGFLFLATVSSKNRNRA